MKINQCGKPHSQNEGEKKNYIVISTDADSSTDEFDKIQHLS